MRRRDSEKSILRGNAKATKAVIIFDPIWLFKDLKISHKNIPKIMTNMQQ